MQFDLDRSIADVRPWNYAFVYKGVSYPTRRPTLAMAAELQSAVDKNSMEGIMKFLGSVFFDDRRPPIEEWPAEIVGGVVAGYLREMNGLLRRTFQLPPSAASRRVRKP